MTNVRKQRIARLKKSIALQERTLKNLTEMQVIYDGGRTVALTEEVLSKLQAQLRLLELAEPRSNNASR